jgi:bifunctional non-homologous end joining protein LigD
LGLLDELPDDLRARLRPARPPEWVDPMLATLTDQRFSDPSWIFERKLDGERVFGYRSGQDVRLMSRNKKRIEDSYPEVRDALGRQAQTDFVLDGEVVAFEGRQTSFAKLQQRMKLRDQEAIRRSRVRVFYYAFDLLHLDGSDVTGLPLRERKRLLRSAVAFEDPLRFTTHRNDRGEDLYQDACAKGWEGLIAKRADSPYVHGRSRDWLKFKCKTSQEFVIGGFTDPEGSRPEFGALLVGYHEDGALRYAGKVGTGYNTQTLRDLGARLRKLERPHPPFEGPDIPRRARWVKPELVAQVAFSEWTRDGKLRHPRFEGLRRDKRPAEVVRERPGHEHRARNGAPTGRA